MPDSEVKLPKQWRRWLKAAGLKPVYSTDMHRKRRWMGDHYLKGHDRFWRIDCLGNLDMSEPKEQFDRWANKVWQVGAGRGSEVSLRDFRKDLVVQLLNEAGQVALAYKLYRAWPSEYQVLGELDANGNAVAIQSLKLECEGWERDYEVPEPEEPSFTHPV